MNCCDKYPACICFLDDDDEDEWDILFYADDDVIRSEADEERMYMPERRDTGGF